MAQQTINIGSSPNAGDGDALRVAFGKINANFTESYAATATLGSSKQPLDGTLTALAAVTFAADKGLYATGADAFATYDLTAYGRSLGGAASAAAAKTLLALVAADIGDSTANGRAILTAATYAAMRALLDLEPGVDFDPLSAKGVALGYAGLDGSGKVPTAQLPDAVLGALSYQGTWNATTNSPTIPAAAAGNKGHYRLVAVAGAASVDGITDWNVGDWIVSNGTAWSKIDNTDAVSSVAGLTGIISAAALRSALSLVVGTNVQAWNSNLDGWATKTAPLGTLAIASTKTATVSNTLTFTGADGATIPFGTRTRQTFLSGSGTYTTPANVKHIFVRLLGGGGGGAGSGTTPGAPTAGTATTFSAASAGGGGVGVSFGVPANGGASSGGTLNLAGSSGQAPVALTNQFGGSGGVSFFGGLGWGGSPTNGGSTAPANSGGGGGGAGSAVAVSTGSGGGAGGYVEWIVLAPIATYSYAVGAGGAGGAAGSSGAAGGNGGSGIIIVDEFYQ